MNTSNAEAQNSVMYILDDNGNPEKIVECKLLSVDMDEVDPNERFPYQPIQNFEMKAEFKCRITLWNMIRVMGIIKGIRTWLWWNNPLNKIKKINIPKE